MQMIKMTNNEENKLKRGRAPNWEVVEKKLLREVLADYVDAIENKCTDTNTNKQKLRAWQNVFARFNELNMRQRSLIELKQQWRMSKVEAKKKMSEHRIAKNKTGGGSRPQSPDEDTINLVKMLPLEFEVDHNIFDSDASQIEITGTSAETTTYTENQHSTYNNNSMAENIHVLNIDTPKPKRSKFKKLHCDSGQKISQASEIVESAKLRNTTVLQCLEEEHRIKLKNMAEMHDLQMKNITEAHEWARQEHLLKLKLLQKQLQ